MHQIVRRCIAEALVAAPGAGPHQMVGAVGRTDDAGVAHDALLAHLGREENTGYAVPVHGIVAVEKAQAVGGRLMERREHVDLALAAGQQRSNGDKQYDVQLSSHLARLFLIYIYNGRTREKFVITHRYGSMFLNILNTPRPLCKHAASRFVVFRKVIKKIAVLQTEYSMKPTVFKITKQQKTAMLLHFEKHCPAFWGKTSCVLPQNIGVFCPKTHDDLGQNARRFGAKHAGKRKETNFRPTLYVKQRVFYRQFFTKKFGTLNIISYLCPQIVLF